ncbi:aldo/keto reductase [Alcaligenes faecalis]|uniref:aldo/keto reductase n=1 Tax=Alcaligenes faecalis TaxID=511 RepID=UPI000A2D5230|nr:aldo/keto reductase [Alcaligenes faecalis]KAA1283512.1 aldo/keto reductase [Alcaligenes faecalis]OSZ27939.1 aldo/keto reductase [Alcaligenes faecalis]OSZ35656.1 aldo/keto reductase [Alcaligenes faecalis]
MNHRTLGNGLSVSSIGLGCMGMSEFYSPRDEQASMQVLQRAVELGVTMFDTADMYGPHHNEELIGQFLKSQRPNIKIATKFGIVRNGGEQRRAIDNSPEYARQSCEGSLKRLGVEQIDLYYVHRIEAGRPIEETIQGLVDLKQEGKIAHIGLSEVNADTLRRAHAVHPITAVQSEYSLWTRDVESEVLPVCRELGIGFVAYSPLGRGFLTGRFQSSTDIEASDFRATLPRFQPENAKKNESFVSVISELAVQKQVTPAQIAIAWVLAQGDEIVPIPGTNSLRNLNDNVEAANIKLNKSELDMLSSKISDIRVAGERYTHEGMRGVGL